MSLLPGQIIPPSEPIGFVKENGEVVISKNWWLLLYNLCQQILGNGVGIPSDALIDIESTDIDAVNANVASLRTPINTATLLATDNLLPDPQVDSARLLLALGADPFPVTAADLPGGFGGFANPTASVGLTAVNGSANTAMRSDAAPPIDQTIAPTWTGIHIFQGSALSVRAQITTSAGFEGFRAQNESGSRKLEALFCGSTSAGAYGAAAGTSVINAQAGLTLSINDLSAAAITSTGITITGRLGINNVTPPAQVTGWGTPTGASVVANFPGATATLAQCSAVIAKLITDLKALGLYGA